MIELLKVLLSPHMVWAGVLIFFAFRFKNKFSHLLEAITNRIKHVKKYKKTKDGHEILFEDAQLGKDNKSLPNVSDEPPKAVPEKIEGSDWPEDSISNAEELRNEVKRERTNCYLWQYSYFNIFLARHTQHVLDWFVSHNSPQKLAEFHKYWEALILTEKERNMVVGALGDNFLVELVNGDQLQATPKGKEYQQWRGPLPPRTSVSGTEA